MAKAITSLEDLDDDMPGDPEPKVEPKPTKPPVAAKPKPVIEEEEEEEEEEAAVVPTKPTKPTHSPRLVREALARGATQAYLDANDSATIWEAIHDHDAKSARAEPKLEKKAEPEEEDYDLGPDGEGFDDAAKKLLKKIGLAARKDSKAVKDKLEAEIAELKQHVSQRRTSDLNAMLDDAFDAMPAKFKKIFGDGSGTDPAFTKTAEFKRRASVLNQVNIDPAKATAKAMKRAILAAAEEVFGFVEAAAEVEEEEDPAPKPKKKVPPKDPENGRFTAEDFGNGKIAKGSARQTGLDQLDVRAGVAQIMRNGGYTVSLDGDMDDLPG